MGKKKNKISKPIATESVSSKKKQDAQQANKKYTFDDQTGSAAATAQDKSIIKVSLPPDKVKVIIAEILRHKKETSSDGSASKRMSEKKLKDLYQALADVGFKHDQITDAMKQTVSYGGDLHTALDWLCLNLPDEELPSGLSAKLMEDEKKEKKREKWQPPPPPEAAEAVKPKPNRQKPPKTRVSNKDLVLRYAEQYDEEDEQDMDWLDEEEQREANAKKDPNERYLEVSAILLDAQNAAAMAKKAGDKEVQNQAGKKIRACVKEMAELEEHPLFEPQVKLDCLKNATSQDTNTSQGPETKSEDDGEEEEEGILNMFDSMEAEAEKAAAAEKAAEEKKEKKPAKKAAPLDVRSFEYTRQTWTGKSPKQFLIDWCRKNLPKTDPPKYEKVGAGGNKWRSRVTVDKKKESNLVVCPDIVTENYMEAQHLASVLALWRLCKGQSIHQLLPPPYRDVWLEWKDADAKEKEAKKSTKNKPRDQFVSQLFRQLKLQPGDKKEDTQEKEEKGEENVEDSWDNAEDSWENFDDEAEEEEDVNYTEKNKEQEVPDGNQQPRSHHISGHTLCAIFEKRRKSKAYSNMLTSRQGLPVFQHRDAILDKINREPVVIIAGETGSGKSTQIPQFLLEDLLLCGRAGGANVICTEPRRISAISLAKRVSQEMAENGPGTRDSMVGYQIRMENRSTKTTRLLYCTTGVLLRKLQLDPLLKDVSHVIVDEVHERSVDSDFLLIVLKQILKQRKEFKVILMSATIESEKLSAYFQHCPVVNIPGRTFPVQVYHLEDIIEQTGYQLESDSPYAVRYDSLIGHESATVTLTGKGGQSKQTKVSWETSDIKDIDLSELDAGEYSQRTRQAITRLNPDRINMDIILGLLTFLDRDPTYSHISGAVLVFMPGLANIQELNELLQSDPTFSNPNKYIVIALHSVLSSDNQSAAFDVPPAGVRKVVIATNIAETGITIPDVVFVIDTGKVKETRYNEMSQLSSLEETHISKASAKQRQGRAGRVQEGLCFRLFTKQKYDTFRGFSQPEMLRVPLEELCLHIMKCELGSPEDFLQQALDAPQISTIRSAMNVLREVGACDGDTETPILTPLGHHLAALPVNVRIGKMLLFAAIFGCLEPIAVMAAAMTDKSPFVVPLGKRDQADSVKKAMAIGDSDHITIYKAYAGWKEACQKGRRAEMSYCSKNFLSRTSLLNMQDVKKDLMRLVKSIGFEHAQKSHDKLSANQNAQKYPEVLEISKTVSQTDTFPLTPPNLRVLKSVLTAGLYPNVAMTCYIERPGVGRDPQAVCTGHTVKGGVAAHPASVNRKLLTIGYLVFLEKMKSSRVYMRDSTLVSPYPLLLFGGDLAVQHREKLVSVDDWIKFEAPARTAVIFKELRSLLSAVLAKKLKQPSTQLHNETVIQILMELIQCER